MKKEDISFCKSGKSVKEYSVVENMNTVYRAYMEDRSKCIDEFGNNPKQGFFAIYDGHGGKDVADFCTERLHQELINALKNSMNKTMEDCITHAFLTV